MQRITPDRRWPLLDVAASRALEQSSASQLLPHTLMDRAGLEKASCECYAIVKERFDAFLKPPASAVQGNTMGRNRKGGKSEDR